MLRDIPLSLVDQAYWYPPRISCPSWYLLRAYVILSIMCQGVAISENCRIFLWEIGFVCRTQYIGPILSQAMTCRNPILIQRHINLQIHGWGKLKSHQTNMSSVWVMSRFSWPPQLLSNNKKCWLNLAIYSKPSWKGSIQYFCLISVG